MTLDNDQKHAWEDNGFLLIKGFYNDKVIDDINSLVDQLWANRSKLNTQYVVDIFFGTEKERRVYFSDVPANARKSTYKLNDLYLSRPEVRDIVIGEKIAPILGDLLDGFPMVCNSLNFEFGSQQENHFDTFYMPSPTPNKMIASWVALEDATENNGPLSYYAGSHKIPPYHFSNGSTVAINDEMPLFRKYIAREIEKRDLKPQTLLAEKGDLLIWHSQLFHGGSPINDKSQTRKSLVTHYFTKEDFPNSYAPKVGEHGCYMMRSPQWVAKASPYQKLSYRVQWLALKSKIFFS